MRLVWSSEFIDVYREYCDPFNHHASYARLDLSQSWKRTVESGRRSTDATDFPSHKSAYALRNVDSVVRRAREMGTHTGRLAERLLGGPLPWLKMRQGYGGFAKPGSPLAA